MVLKAGVNERFVGIHRKEQFISVQEIQFLREREHLIQVLKEKILAIKKTYSYTHSSIRVCATTSALIGLEDTDFSQTHVILGLTKLTV